MAAGIRVGALMKKDLKAGMLEASNGRFQVRAEILIVGGGVMGTSIAMHTAQRTDPISKPVVLFEKRDLGSGSSGHSGAILRQHYAEPVVARMARDSLREYAGFEARTGRSLGFRRTGVLTLAGAETPDLCERLRANVEMLKGLGVETELVEETEIQELVPGIEVKLGTIAAWEPDGGFVDPDKTISAFAALGRASGAVTRLGAEVQKILVENGKVVGAETSEGPYTANKICVVAGPWSAGLLRPLGLNFPLRTIRPESHFVVMRDSDLLDEDLEDEAIGPREALSFDDIQDPIERAAESTARASLGLHPVVVDLEQSFYMRCEPNQRRTRLGRVDYDHDEVVENPDMLKEEVSQELIDWTRRALERRMPTYADQPDAGSQASMYTITPDAQALIGTVPGIEGLSIVTGFSGHGFKLAPVIGAGVAQMLMDERITTFDAEFFTPTRFKGGEAFDGRFGF